MYLRISLKDNTSALRLFSFLDLASNLNKTVLESLRQSVCQPFRQLYDFLANRRILL